MNLQGELSAVSFFAVIILRATDFSILRRYHLHILARLYFIVPDLGPLTRTGAMNIEANFSRIEIRFPATPMPAATSIPPVPTAGRPVAASEAELQNFANWFSYHRSRLLAARCGR